MTSAKPTWSANLPSGGFRAQRECRNLKITAGGGNPQAYWFFSALERPTLDGWIIKAVGIGTGAGCTLPSLPTGTPFPALPYPARSGGGCSRVSAAESEEKMATTETQMSQPE